MINTLAFCLTINDKEITSIILWCQVPQKTCHTQNKLVPKLKPEAECTTIPQEVCQLRYTSPKEISKPLKTRFKFNKILSLYWLKLQQNKLECLPICNRILFLGSKIMRLLFGRVCCDCLLTFSSLLVNPGNTKRGKYHCTIDLLLDSFGLVCFANKNENCQLSYSWFQTSQIGGH